MMQPVSYFLATRGNCCENCGCPFTYDNPCQRHHCIQPRMKRYPELDDEINIELACTICHLSGRLDTTEHAIEFAKRQISRGYKVIEWWDDLPLKTRRFDLRSLLEG